MESLSFDKDHYCRIYRSLEVVRMFLGKKCKTIVFGHMDTKLISIKKLSHLTFIQRHLSCLMTKSTKWHVCPVKTQISMGICPVWSESSLSAWRMLGSLATHWVHSEDSDQTGRMPKLIWVFAGHTGHFVRFVIGRLIICLYFQKIKLETPN